MTTDAWRDRRVLATVLCADLRCLHGAAPVLQAQKWMAGNMYVFDEGCPANMRATV
jgi:hypothetical protein